MERLLITPCIAVFLFLLFLPSTSIGQIYIDANGIVRDHRQPVESQQATVNKRPVYNPPQTKLTNQDVIGMVSLGLPEDVIISKIQSVALTDFDTSLSALEILKAKSVPDSVIRVMINPHPILRPAPVAIANPLIPSDVGVFAVLGGKLAELQREQFAYTNDISLLKTLGAPYGISKMHQLGRITNSASLLRFSSSQELDFIIKSTDLEDGSSFRLLRLQVKKGYRQFHLMTISGPVVPKASWDPDKEDLPLTPEKFAEHTWRVRTTLKKGEYVFLGPITGHERSPDAMHPVGRVYTFGVD